eukprot:14739060-Alexandrium_andersonii.AAC.1
MASKTTPPNNMSKCPAVSQCVPDAQCAFGAHCALRLLLWRGLFIIVMRVDGSLWNVTAQSCRRTRGPVGLATPPARPGKH